jgi:hypothetical protein
MSVQTNDRVAMQVFLPRDVVEKVDKLGRCRNHLPFGLDQAVGDRDGPRPDRQTRLMLKPFLGCPSCPL